MKKILIVDDDTDLSYLVKEILDKHGYHSRTYSRGLNVLEVALNYAPDLILLDVRIGEYEGGDICKRLKRDLTIPIVLFSADAIKGKAFADCDADGFIEKPFGINEFVNAVRSYISMGKQIF